LICTVLFSCPLIFFVLNSFMARVVFFISRKNVWIYAASNITTCSPHICCEWCFHRDRLTSIFGVKWHL
jgi:hypothetical protein